VFAAVGGVARLRTVQVGQRSGLRAQIEAGLEEGEHVVVSPGDRIQEGIALVARDL
jgi:HlyD family secretion protein